jgi:fructose-1,6-bisphosphatase I
MAANESENGPASSREEKINTNIVTLTRFLTEEQSKHKEATGDFTFV